MGSVSTARFVCPSLRFVMSSPSPSQITIYVSDFTRNGLRVETDMSIIVACVPTLQPLYLATAHELSSSIKVSYDPATHRYQARSGAGAVRSKRTVGFGGRIGNVHGADPEAGIRIEMTTYVSSGRQNKSGSEKDLVRDAEMLGNTAETIIKVSSAHVPT